MTFLSIVALNFTISITLLTSQRSFFFRMTTRAIGWHPSAHIEEKFQLEKYRWSSEKENSSCLATRNKARENKIKLLVRICCTFLMMSSFGPKIIYSSSCCLTFCSCSIKLTLQQIKLSRENLWLLIIIEFFFLMLSYYSRLSN